MKKFIILCSMFIAAVMLCPIAFAEGTYEYAVDAITAVDLDNKPIEYQSGSCSAKINVSRNFVRAGADEDYLVVSAYDTEARLVGFYTVSTDSFAANKPASVSCLINVDKEVELGRISAYVWDNFNNHKPLSEVKTLILNGGAEPEPTPGPSVSPEPEEGKVYVDGTLIAANDGTDRDYGLYNNVLRIKEDKASAATTAYALSDNAVFYVNGVEYCEVAGHEDTVRELIADSKGQTALVDDDLDGRYDRIMIDYYIITSVGSVTAADGAVRILVNAPVYSNALMVRPGSSLEISENASVIRDGRTIKPTELEIGDVVAVKYDVGGKMIESSFIEIIATNKTVSGKYTDYDLEYDIYIIGGIEYKSVSELCLTIGEYYNCSLDPWGRLFDCKEDARYKKFAIVESYVDISKTTFPFLDTDCMKVVTLDGQVKILHVNRRYQQTVRAAMEGKGIGISPAATTAAIKDRIIEYTVRGSDDTINQLMFVNAEYFMDAYYRRSTNRLSKALSADAIVLDATEYDETDKYVYDYRASSLDELGDGVRYDGILLNRNSLGEYTHVIITKASCVLAGSSEVAIAAANGSTWAVAQVDGEDVYTLNVMKDSNDRAEKLNLSMNVEVFFKGQKVALDDIKRGSAFVYTIDRNGFIDEINILYNAESDYSKLLANAKTEEGGYLSLPAVWNIRAQDWAITLDDRVFTAEADQEIQVILGVVTYGDDKRVDVVNSCGDYILPDECESFVIDSNSKIYTFAMDGTTGSAAFGRGGFEVNLNRGMFDYDGKAWLIDVEDKYNYADNVQVAFLVVVDGVVQTGLVMDN